jgi:hypothetical protein
MRRRLPLLAIGLLAGTLACADREMPTTPGVDSPTSPETQGEANKAERIAQLFARALEQPDFREYVKQQLDASPFPEHKIQLQRFLQAGGRRGIQALAQANLQPEVQIDEAARAAMPLEVYLPVPAHRSQWQGDDHVLVATAQRDRDVPVAFDLQGRRHLLSPDHPPRTPVLAVVPVETDFDREPVRSLSVCPVAEATACSPAGGGGGGPTAPGLYLASSHFVQSFEGWLKGSPEFEIHIMGQKGSTDSLTRYRCAGEHAPVPYFFDQNELDWSGYVMLFSQAELDAYKAGHPGQAFRIVVMEDDDTACEMKVDQDRWNAVVTAIGPTYRDITGAIDTLTTTRILKAARSLQNLLAVLASWIKTNDDLIGTAIEDKVVGEYHPGFNWIVKGEAGVTNGWLNLVMR